MKMIGVILLMVGLVMSIYTGITLLTREEVVQIGDLEITQEEEHEATWSPYLGIGVMAVGGVILLVGGRR